MTFTGDQRDNDWVLLDASVEHDADPDGFPIPPVAERTALHVGDMVKLVFILDPPPESGPNAERMWVEVALAHDDGSFAGWLTNEPVVISSLSPSASITFEPRHVAGIALRDEEVSFDVTLRAVASTRALEVEGPPGWVGRDEPVTDEDSGWSLTAGDESEDYFEAGDAGTTLALTLGELVDRYPALVEVFQSGAGEWLYRPDQRRYIRIKSS